MQVRLEVSHKSGKQKTVNIHSDAVIGRSTECSLRIASSEISRQHCKLTVIDSGVLVRDLGSANGTWVNGQMIPPNRDVAVRPGCRLSIGPVQFVVHYESSNPNIDLPGSTVELPPIPVASPTVPSAESAEPSGGPDVAAALAEADSSPPDDAEAAATVVIDPGAVQQVVSEGYREQDSDPKSIEIDLDESSEVDEPDALDVEAADDAAAVADGQPETAPAEKKGKAGSLFGGLLKFGRKSKKAEADQAATTQEEPPAVEGEVPSEVDDDETTEEATDDDGLDVEYEDEDVEQEDVEYAGDDELDDDEAEGEGEIDEELGDFFSQFEK